MIFFARLGLTFILVVTFVPGSNCQSMTDLFRLLPSAYTPELNSKEKEILIERGEYIIPGGDSNETVRYSMDTTEGKNYLRCEYSFTTGQRAFSIIEIKKLRKTNGEFILVFSQYAGVPVEFDEREFKIYDIKNGKLTESRGNMIPKNIGLKELLKNGISDSLLAAIEKSSCPSFDLMSERENEIEFRIYFPDSEDEYKSYMIGNAILLSWNGMSFTKKIIND